MEIRETPLSGCYLLTPKVFGDARGFFTESYNRRVFEEAGLTYDFVQDNHARSGKAGVLRGLHFQTGEAAQAKLVRVTRGAVYDVAVDLRAGSPTHGQWFGAELSQTNFRMLLVPRGFAHGYLTLTPDAEFLYKVDNYYSPAHDAGIAWNDPGIGVAWPLGQAGVEAPTLSEKDANLPTLSAIKPPF